MRCVVATLAASICLTQPAKCDEVPKMDPRGAVLCSYSITTKMEKYARVCSDDASPRIWLRDLVDLHRDFVSRNAGATDEELNAFERQQSTLPDGIDLCELKDIEEMFGSVLVNEESFRAEIEKSLSFDREPVWNPCL